jgi:hypothetical protein
VTKLTPAGAFVYSTFLGGSGQEAANGVAVDAAGNAHVAGSAGPGFPTVRALQPASRGGTDALVLELNASGSALVYATYLGGSADWDIANAVALDAAGNTYVTGETYSTDFPAVGSLGVTHAGIYRDAFVARIEVGGGALAYSTYLAGNREDTAAGLAVDAAGNAHVTGSTNSLNFPTAGAWQPGTAGGYHAFVAKISPLARVPSPSPTPTLTPTPTRTSTPTATPIPDHPTVDAGGPYDVAEGDAVVLRATGFHPQGWALKYAWDLDGDGYFETSGSSVRFSAAGLDGPRTGTVTVRATDSAGVSATAQATVGVRNARPSATFVVSPATVDEGGTLTGTFTNGTDPSPADVTAGLRYAVGCGGGWSPESASPTQTCTALESPGYAVSGRIRDKDGGERIYTQQVTIRNLPPTVSVTSPAPGARVAVGASIGVSDSFADPGVKDTHTCAIDWGDGATTAGAVTERSGRGTCTGSRTYPTAGIRTIRVVVRDDEGAEAASTVGIVVGG